MTLAEKHKKLSQISPTPEEQMEHLRACRHKESSRMLNQNSLKPNDGDSNRPRLTLLAEDLETCLICAARALSAKTFCLSPQGCGQENFASISTPSTSQLLHPTSPHSIPIPPGALQRPHCTPILTLAYPGLSSLLASLGLKQTTCSCLTFGIRGGR